MKKLFVIVMLFLALISALSISSTAKADELTDNIEGQLDNLDLSGLDEYYGDVVGGEKGIGIIIREMLSGEFSFDYKNISDFVIKSLFAKIKTLVAPILTVIALAVFLSFLNGIKGSFFNESIYESVFIACFSAITVILISVFSGVVINIKNDIENLNKLSEIMSPIILTLMISSGAEASASVYKPSVAFLSGGIMQVIRSVVLPLIGISTVFGILSFFSREIKVKKFSEFFTSIVKWIFGVVITVYSVFLTIQGIGSVTYDGVSFKAAKYVLSNSVPIVGGFLKDGFDMVVAGSILIKNTVGIAVVAIIFYTVISSVVLIASFSVLLNFTASVTESFSDERISAFCSFLSKQLTFLLAALLIVGMMFFLTVIIMIFTANGVL